MHLSTLRPGATSLTSAFSSLTLKTTIKSTTTTTTTASARAFSTTPAALTKTIPFQRIPATYVPPYPYGPRLIYKQSNKGLYGNARPRHGHNVSEKHHQVTPRVWRPNVHRRKIWSECLGAWVRTRLTTRVLRTIRKEGGLDEYVLKDKAARVKELGPGGWALRWLVMQTLRYKRRMLQERADLGVWNRHMPADNTELVPILVRVALSGKLRRSDEELIEKMAGNPTQGFGLQPSQLRELKREFALGEEASNKASQGKKASKSEPEGKEASQSVVEDEAYEMDPEDGPKAGRSKEAEVKADEAKTA